MNIGFVGLGTMGTPMVLNLLKSGFPVKVCSAHIDSPNVRTAVRQGAVAVGSPREAAKGSEIVLMCLPRAEVSESVVFGRRGVLAGSAPGTIIVEMSTVPPSTVVKIGRVARRKRVRVLDAPISGGRVGAELGTLTIMVGGESDAFERCLPVFEAVGKKIYHVGGLGSGETVKLINGMIGNANLLAALEGLELASRAKIELKYIQSIVANSTGQSWTWNNLIPRMLDAESVGVKIDVLLKDIGYVLALADEVGSDAKMTKEASAILSGLRESRGGSTDISSAFPFLREAGRRRKAGEVEPSTGSTTKFES
ncbi:MAG: NAD(P)-dependent oxidoreductase [Thaumarchaeota archaeon]|nr:NAD(P)-dependent oxidoreductase [Nitrososphaerota archaeon]